MKIPVLFLLPVMMIVAACTHPRVERRIADTPVGFAYTPGNVIAVDRLPQGFRRVAVLPMHQQGRLDADINAIHAVFLAELRRTARIEVVEIDAETLFRHTGVDSLSAQAALPIELLAFLSLQLGVDGIMQLDLTAYRPYRPMVIGIRGRLVATETNRVLWACDEIFDAGLKSVTIGARKFAQDHLRQRYPLTDSHSALQSPQRFASYVAFTLFQTLPTH